MKKTDFSELTDEELLKNAKAVKSSSISFAVLLGVMIGVAVYSTVKNGFGFFTFFPLFFVPIAVQNMAQKKAVEKELRQRNLQ